jgi:hypothetical protein
MRMISGISLSISQQISFHGLAGHSNPPNVEIAISTTQTWYQYFLIINLWRALTPLRNKCPNLTRVVPLAMHGSNDPERSG